MSEQNEIWESGTRWADFAGEQNKNAYSEEHKQLVEKLINSKVNAKYFVCLRIRRNDTKKREGAEE